MIFHSLVQKTNYKFACLYWPVILNEKAIQVIQAIQPPAENRLNFVYKIFQFDVYLHEF